MHARRRQSQSSSVSYSTAPPPHEGPPSFQSAAALAKAQEAEAHSRSVHPSQPNISQDVDKENLFTSQERFYLVIISFILVTLMWDFAAIL